MSARFISTKVLGSLVTLFFVVCFNFFLFRVVEGDPVANLYRGRNLTESQRAALTKQFGLDKSKSEQFVSYLEQTAQLNLGRSYTSNQPVWERDQAQDRPDDRAGGHLGRAVGRLRRPARDRRRVAKTHAHGLLDHRRSRWAPTRCPTSGSA